LYEYSTDTSGTVKSKQVCVKECPSNKTATIACMVNDDVTECPILESSATSTTTAPNVTLDTRNMMGYCVPKYSEMKEIASGFYEKMDKSTGGAMSRYIVDVMEGWWVILVSAVIAFLASCLYLYLLKWTAKLLIYASIFGLLFFGIMMTAFSGMQMMEAPQGSEDQQYSLALTLLAGIITCIWIAFICCLWDQIAIGVAIIQCAGQFLSKNSRIVYGPIAAFLLSIPIIVWWMYTNIHIYSIGKPIYQDGDMFPSVDPKDSYTGLFWFIFAGMLWCVLFMSAMQSFATAYTAVKWYFYH